MRMLRAERGWSQERLAEEAGLNRTYLSAVERSEQNISIDNQMITLKPVANWCCIHAGLKQRLPPCIKCMAAAVITYVLKIESYWTTNLAVSTAPAASKRKW